MQKKDRQSYQSKKVLGQIFRSIDKSSYKNYKSSLTSDSIFDIRLRVPKMELYIAEARELRTTYNQNLSAHMNQFGVQTEAEICSGYVIKWLKKGKSKNNYQQHEYTMKAIKSFKNVWKKRFEKEFRDKSDLIDPSKRPLIEAKAAAWYYVTYHPNERERDMSVEGGFFSFPWIVSNIICEIAKRSTRKPDEIDIEASLPFSEEAIKEGSHELARMNDSLILVDEDIDDDEVDDEDEDDDEDDYDDDIEDDEDEEVVIYNLNSRDKKTHPAQTSNSIKNQEKPNQSDIISRPLEPHQSVVSADATTDELLKALNIDQL